MTFSFCLFAQKISIFKVDDFPGGNDREKINAAFSAMKNIQGEKTLSFTKREYLIEPVDKDAFAPVIGVDKVSQLTVEGNGAVLVAKDALECQKGYFFKISRFSDLKVMDLSLVHRPLPYVQGKIVSADQKNNSVTVELDQAFGGISQLTQTQNSQIWCRTGLKDSPGLPKPNSPSWLEVKTDRGLGIEQRAAGSNRIEIRAGYFNPEKTMGGQYDWSAGDPLVIWKRGSQDGICFEAGRNLILKNIKVNSSLHYAIKVRGVINAEVLECLVEPVAGGMISSSADGIDVQQSEGVRIEKCRIASSGDDAISFLNHGHGFNGTSFEKKFDGQHPETNRDVVVTGNIIIGGNRNGILLLASKAVVEANDVSNIRQYGLKFSGDDTVISRNRFRHCASFAAYSHIADELDTGVICSDEWVQKNATIEENTIEDWDHMPGLLLKSVTGAKITGNSFIMHDSSRIAARPFNQYLKQNKAICVTTGSFNNEITRCADVEISGNTVSGAGVWSSFEDAFQVNGTCENLKVEGNCFRKLSIPPPRSGRIEIMGKETRLGD